MDGRGLVCLYLLMCFQPKASELKTASFAEVGRKTELKLLFSYILATQPLSQAKKDRLTGIRDARKFLFGESFCKRLGWPEALGPRAVNLVSHSAHRPTLIA